MHHRPPRLRLQSQLPARRPFLPTFSVHPSSLQYRSISMITSPSQTQTRPSTLPRPQLSTSQCITCLIRPHQKRTIRTVPIGKRKHAKISRFNNGPGLAILGASPAAAYQRKLMADTLPPRTGVLAVKKGMTAIYIDASGAHLEGEGGGAAAGRPMEGGRRMPATVLQMDRVQVVANKTREKHGYFAVVVGEGWRKPARVGKAMMGVFAKSKIGAMASGLSAERVVPPPQAAEGEGATERVGFFGLPPKREIREFKVRDEKGLLPIGTFIQPSWFSVGQYVDARGTARGMGFAGGMKRHGFHGQGASHGVSLTHRSMGSAGGGQGSGSRVHPGKKMAGNMGGQRHTVQNLKVLFVDEANGLVVVNGAVSGRRGDLVLLSDAIKKPWPELKA